MFFKLFDTFNRKLNYFPFKKQLFSPNSAIKPVKKTSIPSGRKNMIYNKGGMIFKKLYTLEYRFNMCSFRTSGIEELENTIIDCFSEKGRVWSHVFYGTLIGCLHGAGR